MSTVDERLASLEARVDSMHNVENLVAERRVRIEDFWLADLPFESAK